jgi:hypothetical protein
MPAQILEVVGWAGSLLLIVSLLQSNIMWLRLLNLTASVLLVYYNSVLGIGPMIAMNLAVVIINAWQISRLIHARHSADNPAVKPAGVGAPEFVPETR